MGIAHWAPGNHRASGRVTLTRFVDTTNNSNKYRRFIVLSAAGEPHLLITQTGRWTDKTARGDWSGGTYRFQRKGTAAWERRATASEFLSKHVQRKLGGYGVASVDEPLSAKDLQLVIDRTPNLKTSAGLTLPAAQPTAPVQAPAPAPGVLSSPPSPSAPAGQHVGWLLDMTRVDGADQMELLAHYAQISGRVKYEEERIREAVENLSTALTLIMQK